MKRKAVTTFEEGGGWGRARFSLEVLILAETCVRWSTSASGTTDWRGTRFGPARLTERGAGRNPCVSPSPASPLLTSPTVATATKTSRFVSGYSFSRLLPRVLSCWTVLVLSLLETFILKTGQYLRFFFFPHALSFLTFLF